MDRRSGGTELDGYGNRNKKYDKKINDKQSAC